MKLPFLISVPHAGLRVPPEAQPYCVLTEREIFEDGDEGAGEVYRLEQSVAAFQTTDVARAIVDLNRSEDDRRRDGVVKTHTCWNVPVYSERLPGGLIQRLLDHYYRPYHKRLREFGRRRDLHLGLDCHTMAATGPPVGPDPGIERPWICLSNGEGTCPQEWIETLRECFASRLDGRVTINDPFTGGFITRQHSNEMPWLQIEMTRALFLPVEDKRRVVLESLQELSARIGGVPDR